MTEIGEGIGISLPEPPSNEKKEPCKRIYLHAFRGDRSPAFLDEFERKRQQSEAGTGPGPTFTECLIWSGHVGVSFEAQSPIYGFNPNPPPTEAIHEVLDKLKGKKAYPGHVTDDTAVFDDAKRRGLSVVTIEYVYPESEYDEIKGQFDAEKSSCSYDYSFPGGAGGCNCATFPARIGVPVPEPTGNMRFYMKAAEQAAKVQKMGDCEG